MDKPYFGKTLLRTKLALPGLAECVGLPNQVLPSSPNFLKTRQRRREKNEYSS